MTKRTEKDDEEDREGRRRGQRRTTKRTEKDDEEDGEKDDEEDRETNDEEGEDGGGGRGGGRRQWTRMGRTARTRTRAAKGPLKSTVGQSPPGSAPSTILSMYLVRHNSPKEGDLNNIHLVLNKKPRPRVIHLPLTWGNE